MRDRRAGYLATAACALASLLAGCGGSTAGGGGSTPNPISKGAAADLRGGWLVAGTMPNAAASLASFQFGLTLNLDIINGQVVGSGLVMFPCNAGNGGVGGGIILEPATVAADGTFTLTDRLFSPSSQHQIEVKGHVPAATGGVWSGTYTASAANASCNGVPPPSQAGQYTTQKIADLNGTFVGSGRLNNGTSPITISAAITQGGSPSVNGVSSLINDQSVLTGTLRVQGFSCFNTGTMKLLQGIPDGAVEGNHLQMQFTMDDGSIVFLTGFEADLAASNLTRVTFLVNGGLCDKAFATFDAGLTKQ